ncbi:hypothetical protein [Novosphingobium beihaiensis]|uniref:Uncharacterized protein n=1 Tax=Novosphingobium beihaiensis TaxID=2930389 RepID=A0ABT0BN65_9SPHN|nr:hypothetical protein [Novosphingobium beihaiensis]MCJ2186492.1 hypothetical protein [Novosphingobium beihaiensis]
MSVVISEVEHRPSPETEAEAPATAPRAAQAMTMDDLLTKLRRARSRRARLWAD